jgi:ATP-dependent RNA helicase DHX36
MVWRAQSGCLCLSVAACLQTDNEAARENENMRRQQAAFHASPSGKHWAAQRSKLPVVQVKSSLLAALKDNHSVVLSGDTGCGKTTQVPQYLLEHEVECGRGAHCHIICTQPRRIAATSVAERVAEERGEAAPGMSGSRVGCATPLPHCACRQAAPTLNGAPVWRAV